MLEKLLTFSGQLLLLLGAVLGAGVGLRYFLEPLLKRRRLRKVMAIGLWFSCYELRRHMEAIKATLKQNNPMAEEMRDALLKIPRKDRIGDVEWRIAVVMFGFIHLIYCAEIMSDYGLQKRKRRAGNGSFLGWDSFA